MFKGMIAAVMVAFAGMAMASDDFTFDAVTVGTTTTWETSNPAHTVDYVSLSSAAYWGISVDGVFYRLPSGLPNGSLQQLTELDVVNGFAQWGTRTILASLQYTTTRTCNHSGRGQSCTTHYHPYAGEVVTP
jgi:hypothetical protein